MKRIFEAGPLLAVALLVASLSAATAMTAPARDPAPRYFGDEFAAAQRALEPSTSEEPAPTF